MLRRAKKQARPSTVRRLQRKCVDTKPHSGRRRPVFKNVSEMRITNITNRLDAVTAETPVFVISNNIILHRLRK